MTRVDSSFSIDVVVVVAEGTQSNVVRMRYVQMEC